MKRLTIALAALGVLVATGRAHACGGGYGGGYGVLVAGVFTGIAAAGAIDLSFTIHDAVVDRPSVGASVTEIVLTAPQAAFGIWAATQVTNPGDKVMFLLLSAWPAALTAHGIVALAHPGEDTYSLPPTARAIRLAPAPITDGTNVAPGLIAVGRF